MGLVSEFKEFINRGSVIDLAIGVIIGGAFGRIITSLVNDIIMPPIGMLLNGVNFKEIKVVLKEATIDAAGQEVAAVAINIGNFIQIMIEFTIIAIVIFLLVKGINNMRKREETVPPPPAADVVLLTEIRDLLKK